MNSSPPQQDQSVNKDLFSVLGREFIGVESQSDVFEATLAALTQIIEADMYVIAVAEGGVLQSVVGASDDDGWSPPNFPIVTSIPGCVFREQEPAIIDDITDVRGAAASRGVGDTSPERGPLTAIRSLLAVPIGEVGVLVAGAEEPSIFTESDREMAVNLASLSNGALYRSPSEETTGPNLLEEIGGVLSHDLKSPLNVAKGHLALARETGDDEHFSKVDSALDRIEELADDLSMLARTDDRIGSVDLVELDNLAATAWESIQAPWATLEIVDSKPFHIDKSTTCQLLENLFSNAVEHAGPDVTIRIGTLPDGFFVEDDGPGLPPEHRDSVFDWRVSYADNHNGLGLAIVNRIAEAHGWEAQITDAENGGARFEFTAVMEDAS